jgi:hypothetical protein
MNKQHFTLEAGRSIKFDGKPYITILRASETLPIEADDVTRLIVRKLNEVFNDNFEKLPHSS